MKTLLMILWSLLLIVPVHGFNSQVTSEEINGMVRAGVGTKVIDYLIAHQTCSIGARDVIRMKQAGLKDSGIISAIKSDRYRKPEEATVLDELEVIERLKKAGMSDEAVLQYLDRVKSQRHVDSDGRATIRYGNTPRREPYPVDGSQLPDQGMPPGADILLYDQ